MGNAQEAVWEGWKEEWNFELKIRSLNLLRRRTSLLSQERQMSDPSGWIRTSESEDHWVSTQLEGPLHPAQSGALVNCLRKHFDRALSDCPSGCQIRIIRTAIFLNFKILKFVLTRFRLRGCFVFLCSLGTAQLEGTLMEWPLMSGRSVTHCQSHWLTRRRSFVGT